MPRAAQSKDAEEGPRGDTRSLSRPYGGTTGMKPNLMTYKGYVAKVDYDDEDVVFYGTVVDIRDTITFSGASAIELRSSFESAIDDYLAFYEERGREPSRPFSGKVQLRLSSSLHRQSVITAASRKESLNAFFVFCISTTLGASGGSRNEPHEQHDEEGIIYMTGLREHTLHRTIPVRSAGRSTKLPLAYEVQFPTRSIHLDDQVYA